MRVPLIVLTVVSLLASGTTALAAGGIVSVGLARSETAAERFGWVVRDGDEFAGNRLDLGRWRVYDGPGNSNVGLRRPSAVDVKNGSLVITGRGDVSGGVAWRSENPTTYGRWEFRARSDKGNGYSPVVLLWPDSDHWPQDGELDIMEIPAGDRSAVSSALHWGEGDRVETHRMVGDFSDWHVFAVEWMRDYVTVYIDGESVFTSRIPPGIPHGPMHLAIQSDIGPVNNWIPPRDTTTPAEVGLHVDWVRMYY